MTYGSLFREYMNYLYSEDLSFAYDIVDYRPWGENSIVVFCKDGTSYKVKYRGDRFERQQVSNNDIAKKFNHKK